MEQMMVQGIGIVNYHQQDAQSPKMEDNISNLVEDNIKSQDSELDDNSIEIGIKFKDWGFKVDRLFEVAHRFYKRNESKAFHPSFDVRNQMNALILQARYGNIDSNKAPDVGVLDLVGKSRRHQWSLLKDMSKTEAMSKFICTLDEICPFFKAHAEAVQISCLNSTTNNNRSNESSPSSSSTSSSAATKQVFYNTEMQVKRNQNMESAESEDQLKAIRTSLYRQTFEQFKSYAEKQYPDDPSMRKHLIATLQEQYYQQYISQMHPELNVDRVDQKVNNADVLSKPLPSASMSVSTTRTEVDDGKELNYGVSTTELKHESKEFSKSIDTNEQTSKVLYESNKETILSNEKAIEASDETAMNGVLSNSSNSSKCNIYNKSGDTQTTLSNNIEVPSYQYDINPNNIGQFESYPEPKLIQPKQPAKQTPLSIAINMFMPEQQPTEVVPQLEVPQKNKESSEQHSLRSDILSQDVLKSEPPLSHLPMPFQPLPTPPLSITGTPPTPILNNQQPVDTWCNDSASPNSAKGNLEEEEGSNDVAQLRQDFSRMSYEPLEPATIWTKKGVIEFRESLMDDKHGGVHVVNQSALLTIQVPTYPDGKYIYWEFSTEDYDIAFGLDFVYDSYLIEPLALRIFEENDSDDEYEESELEEQILASNEYDLESSNRNARRREILEQRRIDKLERDANTISIIPTYRRDSHEEVFVGRHRYPGKGYYLLKFDNTYSVLRSKTLHFRICYFI